MRHSTLLSGIICMLCLLAACGDSHFMTDASYRSRVERDFQQKKALMPQGDLFAIFDTSLSDYEREALSKCSLFTRTGRTKCRNISSGIRFPHGISSAACREARTFIR